MAYKHYNENPTGRTVGDCAVRAVSKALGITWETAYITLVINGYGMGDMPSADSVWGATLRQQGFSRQNLPDTCPDCYTVEDFCRDNPVGVFVIGTGGHVVTAINGDWFDAWDSGGETVQFVWYRNGGQ